MLRIAHVSDLHAVRPLRAGERNAKRLLGAVNQALFRGRRLREDLAAERLSRLAAEAPDLALFTGDAGQHGLAAEFVRAEELFQPLTARGIPVIAVGGNHDYYGSDSAGARGAFFRRLSLDVRPGADGIIRSFPGVEILPLEQGVRTWPFFSGGRQSQAELDRAWPAWSSPPAGVMRLVCGHFPVSDARGGPFLFLRALAGAHRLAAFLAAGSAAGYFCGHNHRRFETDLPGGCRQYAAPALSDVDGPGAAIYECGTDAARPRLVQARRRSPAGCGEDGA